MISVPSVDTVKINNLHMRNVLVSEGGQGSSLSLDYGFLRSILVARNEEFMFVINVEIPRVIH